MRQPAAFCGVVGVKPTYGRVSRYGLVAFASSLDQIGVVRPHGRRRRARSRGDRRPRSARLDERRRRRCRDYRDAARGDADGRRDRTAEGILPGRPRPAHSRRAATRRSMQLQRARREVRDVSLPHTTLAIPVYYIIAPAEASSNLARFDGVRYGLRIEGDGLRGDVRGDALARLRRRGHAAHPARHVRALRRLLRRVLPEGAAGARADRATTSRNVFASGVDVLFTPTTPTPAFPLGAKSDPYEMYLSDIFTATANLAGVPAMSVPIGRVDGLPVGGQFIAPHFDERDDVRARRTRSSARSARRRTDERRRAALARPVRDGRRARGARAAQDARRRSFCRCSTDFGAPPNANTCPVCLALPGALPVLNEHAVELAIARGARARLRRAADVDLRAQELLLSRPAQGLSDLAVRQAARDRRAASRSAIARRRLADHASASRACTWRRTRASRFTIGFAGVTAIDLNRAGVPLDRDRERAGHALGAEQAGAYLRVLKQILEYVDVSDVNMEEGSLRVDANVSARRAARRSSAPRPR